MDSFAFIIHAMDAQDIKDYKIFLRLLPNRTVEYLASHISPFVLSHVSGVRSQETGKEIEGWFVGLPMTSRVLIEYSYSFVSKQIHKCGLLAEKLGAKIIGLGAFTSVAGDGGVTPKKGLNIAVTTGNSYTVATALEATKIAAQKMSINTSDEEYAIVGATGSIGRACALILAQEKKKVRVIGRDPEKVSNIQREVEQFSHYPVKGFTEIEPGIKGCRIILTVTSAIDTIVQSHWIERGAVVCDVSRPRNVAKEIMQSRKDILVIEGGIVDIPGKPDFGMDFGYPPGKAYACMSETMILTLEGRFEDFTLGKEVQVERVKEINQLALKHGFKVSGIRSFDKELTDEEIEAIKRAI